MILGTHKKSVRRNTVTFAAFIIVAGGAVYFFLQHAELVTEQHRTKLLSVEPYIIKWTATDDVSCHYINKNNALISAEDEAFSPSEHSVYFLETSCRGGVTTRQACAIESAARSNPDWQINVLFSAPVPELNVQKGSLSVLKDINNVKLVRINVVDFAKGTPLEEFIGSGALNRSSYRVVHTSDVLRILTLYKWGGVYLDLDVVVMKSLAPLGPNWAAREDGTWVANGMLAFSKDKSGRAIAEAAVRELQTNFKGTEWAYNGPGLMTRVRNKLCPAVTTNQTTSADSAAICQGFVIYPPEYFYPIHWSIRNQYFDPGELDPKKVEKAYAHHVWNALTKNVNISKDSPYAKLAKRYCPSIYGLYGELFGA